MRPCGGAPRSASQYHSEKAITLDSQMTPPAISSLLASSVNGFVLIMLTSNLPTSTPLSAEIKTMRTIVITRSQFDSLSMRPGSPSMSATRSAPTTTRYHHRESPRSSGGSCRNSAGRAACSPPTASTARAIGQRGSPILVERRWWISSPLAVMLIWRSRPERRPPHIDSVVCLTSALLHHVHRAHHPGNQNFSILIAIERSCPKWEAGGTRRHSSVRR